jgi:hypothetical protein
MAFSVAFSMVIGGILLLLILLSTVYILEAIYQWIIKIK